MTRRQRASQRRNTAKQKRSSKSSPALLIALVTSMLTLAAGGTLFLWAWLPGPQRTNSVALRLADGSSIRELSDSLLEAGLIREPWLFDLYMQITWRDVHPVTGTHYLKPQLSPRELARCLTQDPRRPKVTISIPEGFDQFRIASRLDSLGICSAREFLAASSDPGLLHELSISGSSAEGYLFPLTYAVPIDTQPRDLIARWVSATRRHLETLSQAHDQGLYRLKSQRDWDEHEILTLASIVEKESRDDNERRIIAGVFLNRLDDEEFRPRHTLQSDPTAYYGCLVSANQYPGCVGNPGHVIPAMLRDPQNPYNTYRHAGLPPGPIANPGESSIAAVMNPVKTNYLFFFAKNGKHVFSQTLGEHENHTRAAD